MIELPPVHGSIRHPHRVAVDRTLQLDAAEVAALRFREVNVSEAFTLQGPDGTYYRASLKGLGERGGEALVYEEMARPPESGLSLALFCAVLARQRMLQVVPRATELGALLIQPVISAQSVQPEGLDHEKAHAWPRAAVRAMRQCRRAVVPLVPPAVGLEEALAHPAWTGAAMRLYLDDRAAERPRLLRGPASVAIATGPEGGWTDAERERLRAAGAQPFHVGGRVLRADTAVLAGLTVIQHRLGDM